MALIKCHECGREISSDALACPGCGAAPKALVAQQPKSKSIALTMALAWGILGLVIWAVYSQSTKQPVVKSAAEVKAAEGKEREFQAVAEAMRGLKNSLKNPKSFELVSVEMMPGRTLCIVYRGTNSFNAVITTRYVVSTTVSSDSADAWSKHCLGRSGVSFDHVKYAI